MSGTNKTKTDYNKIIVKSDKKVIFGKHATTLLVSNIDLNNNVIDT